MQKSQLKLMGAVAAVAVIAGGGVGVWSVMKDDSSGTVLLSAAEGAAARADRDSLLPSAAAPVSESAAFDSKLAADALPIDCGNGGEPYVPSPEELATANADTEALIAVLDKYGLTYDAITDPSGFKYVETDYKDMIVTSVVSSFWDLRYPIVPPTQAEYDDVIKQNDVVAASLDNAGVAYTRSTDDYGWDTLEWNYDDPTAQAAVDAAYAELYPPQPPSAEDLATMKADNDKLAAAFDAAGIAYTRTSDELGWEWIDWDYDDEALNEKVNAVYEELYPVTPMEGCATLMDDTVMDDTVMDDTDTAVASDVAVEEPTVEVTSSESQMVESADEFTPEQIAQRDAEATALVSGLKTAGVTVRSEGESPWQIVLFDVNNDAAVDVVTSVLAPRG